MRLSLLLVLTFFSSLPLLAGNTPCSVNDSLPFRTDSTCLTMWNGSRYVPIFIKGVNLGASMPGKYPGELDVSRAQYASWLVKMKQAGFNALRLYTLHYPHFYDVLDSINKADPQHPMLVFQGIWLDEDITNYQYDLYQLTNVFNEEIENNINCMHGNNIIPFRYGKAFGSYSTDVSKWILGYIIGREVFQDEVMNTNANHAADTVFNGTYVSLHGNVTEAWLAARIDHLFAYEKNNYNTQRPVSFSSWPTLDPLHHPQEQNRTEDTVSVDLANLDISKAPAGYFVSYHAYPYYPDFMSLDPAYQGYSDQYGPNTYLGYLNKLKEHYKNMPLIIAEYGVPSSWVAAHFAASGMHHGGHDEQMQGEYFMRSMHNIEDAGCGGGMVFAWIDEWFKRTWICDPLDYKSDRRILWHNLCSPEQNFGLIGFRKPLSYQNWASFPSGSSIKNLRASADFTFFRMQMDLKKPMGLPDTIWVALDTYAPTLGESVLPNGQTVSNRAEFVLRITNYSAELYVTEAYDLFGIWHKFVTPPQLYHSIATDGKPWNLVRWRNNSFYSDVQYVGSMQVNRGDVPASSKDAVTIYDDHLDIKIPWSLLQFDDPSSMKAFNDNRATPAPEDTTSDGISVTICHDGDVLTPPTRFTWATWNDANDAVEYEKISYNIMKQRLPSEFNSKAIPRCDNYTITNTSSPMLVNTANGVLMNDVDLDGNPLQAVLMQNPAHGRVNLNLDGSFSYQADPGFTGNDEFIYSVYDGYSLSEAVNVNVNVKFASGITSTIKQKQIQLYPNPASSEVFVQSGEPVTEITLFNVKGEEFARSSTSSSKVRIDISSVPSGLYFVKAIIGQHAVIEKLNVVH